MSQVIPARFEARFQGNLSYLHSHYPTLHEKLIRRSPEAVVTLAPTGQLTLKLRGTYVESPYDPGRESDVVRSTEEGPILYLGSGLGYHINRLQGRERRGSALVEWDLDVFRAALYVLEPAALRNLLLYVGADMQVLERDIPELVGTGRMRVVEYKRSVRLHRQYYDEVRALEADSLKSSHASNLTTKASMRLWMKNVLRNLSSLKSGSFGSRSLKRVFSGPAILVASGPFLEGVVDDLRRWAMRIPVLSLLPSVPFLQHNGIIPDFVVTTDAGFWNRCRFVRGCSVPLITTFSAEPVLVSAWEGVRLFFSHDLPIERLVPPIGQASLAVPMQGTSSIVMVLLARALGFTELYLAGYDFAFCGVKDHHRGAGFEGLLSSRVNRFAPWPTVVTGRMRSEPILPEKDCSGKPVHTSHKLLLYRNWMEREIDCRGLQRLNNGVAVRDLPMARWEDLEKQGPEIRRSFEQAMGEIVTTPLGSGVADEAYRILEGLVGQEDEQGLRRARDVLFGSKITPEDEAAVRSDVDFVRQELAKMKRRRACP
jgi:hypothetical protein